MNQPWSFSNLNTGVDLIKKASMIPFYKSIFENSPSIPNQPAPNSPSSQININRSSDLGGDVGLGKVGGNIDNKATWKIN